MNVNRQPRIKRHARAITNLIKRVMRYDVEVPLSVRLLAAKVNRGTKRAFPR
jgi:hypothetical protein